MTDQTESMSVVPRWRIGTRRRWLEGVVLRHTAPETMRVAEAICRNTGENGECAVSRRDLMEQAEISQSYVWQRSIRHLMDAGDIVCLDPGGGRRPARYALMLHGERVPGGDPDSAPRLIPNGIPFKVVKEESQRQRSRVEPLDESDDLWSETMPWCGHTLRECSPDCPEWGGRRVS